MSFRFLCAACGHAQDAEYGDGREFACQKCGQFCHPFGVAPFRRRVEADLLAKLVDEPAIEDASDGLVAIDEPADGADALRLFSSEEAIEAEVIDCESDEESHGTSIRALAMVGDLLATAGDDGQLRLLEWPSLRVVTEWRGHAGGTLALAAHGARGLLASAGKDKLIRLWRVMNVGLAPSIEEQETLPGDYAEVTALAFSPDGAQLAIASIDGSVTLWSVYRPLNATKA